MPPLRIALRELIAKKGTTQAQLSRDSGVSLTTVNEIAMGKTTRIDLSVLDRLATALDVDPCDLLTRDTLPRQKAKPR